MKKIFTLVCALAILLSISNTSFTMFTVAFAREEKNEEPAKANRNQVLAQSQENKEKRERLNRRIEIKKKLCLHHSGQVEMCGDFRKHGIDQEFWINHREEHIIQWHQQIKELKKLCAQRDALQ